MIFSSLISFQVAKLIERVEKMEWKDQNPPSYGFSTGPPAYEQHQNFPQAPPNFQPQQVPPQASQNYYPTTQTAQVVTGERVENI